MPNAIDILERLVGFASVSARSNLDLIQWVRDHLAAQGIKSDLVPAPDGQPKANLWASIGPDAPGGLVLSGHTDVVPVEGQPWSSDPFTLTLTFVARDRAAECEAGVRLPAELVAGDPVRWAFTLEPGAI